MNDPIERQDAIDAITEMGFQKTSTVKAILCRLETLPSAQPELIRCKDCKHHEDEEPGMVYCPNRVGGWVSEDFFCKDGKRRDE